MKIINTTTNEVLATIVGGNNLTLEEACDLMDIKVMKTQEDYETENGYDCEELALVSDNA